LSRPKTENSEPKLAKSKGEIFDEKVVEEDRHSVIRIAPVNEQQALEISKLTEGKIRRENCLSPFKAGDTFS
jgi:hypothetical protein